VTSYYFTFQKRILETSKFSITVSSV